MCLAWKTLDWRERGLRKRQQTKSPELIVFSNMKGTFGRKKKLQKQFVQLLFEMLLVSLGWFFFLAKLEKLKFALSRNNLGSKSVINDAN